jgi:DNA-binding CsgD family transcriptional regulator
VRQREGFHWFRRWRPTPQQERVLDALLEGRSNAEIAADLGISQDGAKWHVSQLLGETGLEGRHELADWWRGRRERVEARRGLWPPAGLVARAALVAPIVVLGVWLVTSSPLIGGDDDAKGEASQPVPGALASTPLPTAVPSPTPRPSLSWVFDLAAGTAMEMQPFGALMQWLGPERLLSNAGSKMVIVDATGALVADALGTRPQGALYVDQAAGKALAVESNQALWEWDPASGQKRLLLDLGSPPLLPRATSTRMVDVSAAARRIAVGDVVDGSLGVEVMNLDGSERRLVWQEEEGAWLQQLDLSPDGRRLVVATATRTVDGARVSDEPRAVTVLDARTGSVLYRIEPPVRWSPLRWAGPDRVLLAGTEIPFQPSTVVEIRDGSSTRGPDPQGLLCISPDGRYGLYWYQAVTGGVAYRPYGQRVVDFETGGVVLEQVTGVQGGQCDWTEDSTKAVISPGGK